MYFNFIKSRPTTISQTLPLLVLYGYSMTKKEDYADKYYNILENIDIYDNMMLN